MNEPSLESVPLDPVFGKPAAEVIGEWTIESDDSGSGKTTKEKITLELDGTVRVKHIKSTTEWTDIPRCGGWKLNDVTKEIEITYDDTSKPVIKLLPDPVKD